MKKPLFALVLAMIVLFGASVGLRNVAKENAAKAHLEMMQLLLPGATEFEVEPYAGEDANIKSVHKSDIGFVIETSTYGYAGEITVLVGVNNAGKVTGVVVRDAHETFGLGGNALTDHVFLSQFLNSAGSFEVNTSGADAFAGATAEAETAEGEATPVDAITGATVTSKAVVRCVNSAVAFVTGADAATEATSWGG